ncbi:MAG: sigma-54-dependent Fis family transcriptional regulator [Marinobacter sp.]|nr:sigma-54-dependent Fis family transcriptional regulator [Marinobacter sp.]
MRHFHEPNNPAIHGAITGDSGNNTSYIKTSWRRCQDKHKISPQHNIKLCTLTEKEIQEKREPLDKLLSDSQVIIERVRRIAKQSGYSVLISNAEGVTVKAFTDSDHALELQSKGLRLGTLWQEAMVGTNGLGTCLEEKRPITVDASEHYGTNLHCFSCSAAPLIGADGAILGALDMSTFANGNRMGQALALNFVAETADEIEALIFRKAYNRQYIVSLARSMHATTALIAFNENGTIVAATTPALLQLNCRNRYELVGKSFQDAFEINPDELASSSPLKHQFQFNGHMYQYHIALHTAQPQPKQPFLHKLSPAKPSCPPSKSNYQRLLDAAGEDPALLQQAQRCIRIIDRGLSVLLQGETGTGKEVWARALHDISDRKDKPFIAVNCAAIPESLIESELFGYGAGTFTGGLKSGKVGKIEASNGGTLFLDEIGDMPAELQARLLRVLAESEIVPLGEVKPIPVDINVICASHRDLEHYVSQGDFREDLYYRISVFKVSLPSLRNRQDKRHLIYKILDCLKLEDSQNICLSAQAEEVLINYQWPGNIRQLKNVLQYAVCMCDGTKIQIDDLPEEVFKPFVTSNAPTTTLNTSTCHGADPNVTEKQQLIATLEQNRWIVTRAAKALGVSRSTLHRKIKMYGLLLDAPEQ